VTAQFKQSGGIFTGAEVSYRGVRVGVVSDMRLTRDGVDVILSIENSSRPIPADTVAQVANKSAVGEQYVDMQPRTDRAPSLGPRALPYVVASGYTVAAKSPGGDQTRSGLILSPSPDPCTNGYDPKEWRSPGDGSDKPMDEDAHCADPATKSNPRGSQNAPRVAPFSPSSGPVASYDLSTGQLTWNDDPVPQKLATDDSSSSAELARLLLLPLS
jgi:hypothetical protein